MQRWEIPCATLGGDEVTFVVSAYGHVVSVVPDSSPFASVRPLDIDGFTPSGTEPVEVALSPDPPISMKDVTGSGRDVTGMVPVMRAGVTFKAAVVVSAPIRVVAVDSGVAPSSEDPLENEWEVGEWFQRVVGGHHVYDDNPVTLTVRQAMKIGAITGAARSNPLYLDALRDVSWFLSCVAAPAGNTSIETSTTAQEAWERVEKWPWPRLNPKEAD